MRTDPNILAERFIKDQIKIMKKHGKGPTLGTEEYKKLVEDTQRTFRTLMVPQKAAKAST